MTTKNRPAPAKKPARPKKPASAPPRPSTKLATSRRSAAPPAATETPLRSIVLRLRSLPTDLTGAHLEAAAALLEAAIRLGALGQATDADLRPRVDADLAGGHPLLALSAALGALHQRAGTDPKKYGDMPGLNRRWQHEGMTMLAQAIEDHVHAGCPLPVLAMPPAAGSLAHLHQGLPHMTAQYEEALRTGAYRLLPIRRPAASAVPGIPPPPPPPPTSPANTKEPDARTDILTHSPDFHSIRFGGTPYTLTHNQARIIQMLYQAHGNGTPCLSWEHISSTLEIASKKLSQAFRNTTLCGTLIVPGETKGTHRLAPLPDPPSKAEKL